MPKDILKGKKFLLFFIGGAILALTFLGGVYFGYQKRPAIEKVFTLYNKESLKPANVDFEPFWRAWNIVNEKYASDDGADDQKKVWGAIQGMAKALGDPYTVFFPPEEKKIFESGVKGDFGGVGMEIGIRKGILTVVAPLKGTPAYEAGIKPGDRILKIDDKETADLGVDEAVRLIRGPKGTFVTLIILPKDKDETKEVRLKRDTIQIPALDTDRKDRIFIIKLYSFSEKSPMDFRNALREMAKSGDKKLIIDLRNNPGGYLEAAVDVASWFLPIGKIVAREQFKNGEEQLYRSFGYNIFGNIPVVILINGGSASASEILAGALREHKVATLVGEKTFGKGSVQELVSVTDDTSLKVTIARWLTPEGKSISKNGLTPDVEAGLKKEDIEAGRDPQMEKAIEILKNK